MSVSHRFPAAAACALAAAGLCTAMPAHAEWLYGRLVPDPPTPEANNVSETVDVSNDGKTVVFTSTATNWLPGPALIGNKAIAVDLDTGLIEVVSRTTSGNLIRGESPAASRDGRYVAFLDYGSNLDVGVPTSNWQVVRKDRVTGQLHLVSANAGGEATTLNDDDTVSISGDGQVIVFESASPNLGYTLPDTDPQIFVKNMLTGEVKLASIKHDGTAPEDGAELSPHALSDDGRYVAFTARTPLLPGATTTQIYVRDLQQNTTELVSRATGASGQPSTTFASRPSLSPNGRYVSFNNPAYGGLGGDSNTHSGVYLRDRQTHTTVSVPKPNVTGFQSCATSALSDIPTVLMECIVNGRSQVYLFVPGAGLPEPVSEGAGGLGNGASGYSLAVDASGLSMAFESAASDLVPGDTNTYSDIFVLVESRVIYGIFGDGFED